MAAKRDAGRRSKPDPDDEFPSGGAGGADRSRRIPALAYITEHNGAIRIGAMTANAPPSSHRSFAISCPTAAEYRWVGQLIANER